MTRPAANPETAETSSGYSPETSSGDDSDAAAEEDDYGVQEELVEAISGGDLRGALQLLAMRADPDLPTTGARRPVPHEQTPLWIAMRDQESVACIAWLLIAGADQAPLDLFQRQHEGSPQADRIRALIDHYSDENELEAFWKEVRKEHGDVPRDQLLHYAASCGSVVCVARLLLEQSNPGVEIEMASNRGERFTPLSAAYCANHDDQSGDIAHIVLMLLAAKADPFARESDGWCLLDAANVKGDKDLLQVLCHVEGAPEDALFAPASDSDDESDPRRAAIEEKELAAQACAEELVTFVRRGDVDAVLYCLAAGADPDMAVFLDDGSGPWNALRAAAESEAGWETIQYLLAARADPGVVFDDGWSLSSQQDMDMRLSELLQTLSNGRDTIRAYKEEIFAELKQDAQASDDFQHAHELPGELALAHAARDDKPELVCLLLLAKADPECHVERDPLLRGHTALSAIYYTHTKEEEEGGISRSLGALLAAKANPFYIHEQDRWSLLSAATYREPSHSRLLGLLDAMRPLFSQPAYTELSPEDALKVLLGQVRRSKEDRSQIVFSRVIDLVPQVPVDSLVCAFMGLHLEKGRLGAKPAEDERTLFSEFLCHVVEKQNKPLAAMLLNAGPDVCDLSHEDSMGRSALWHAASSGDAVLVERIIGQGAPLSHIDDDLFSPLHAACQGGHLRCAELLLRARAPADGWGNRASDGKGMDAEKGWFPTPLMIACSSGEAECVQLLLGHGAQPELSLGETYWEKGDPRTALEFAETSSSEGNERAALCAKLIQEWEDERRYFRDTSLEQLKTRDRASRSGAKHQEELLKDPAACRAKARLANVDTEDLALFKVREALMLGDASSVTFLSKWLKEGGRHLLDRPVLPGPECFPASRPISKAQRVWLITAAAGHGHADVVQLLLKAKATVDPPEDAYGHWPLFAAATTERSLACMNVLLQHGANPDRVGMLKVRADIRALAIHRKENSSAIRLHRSKLECAKSEAQLHATNAQLAADTALNAAVDAMSDQSPDAALVALTAAVEEHGKDASVLTRNRATQTLDRLTRLARENAASSAEKAVRDACSAARACDAALAADAGDDEAISLDEIDARLAALKGAIGEHAETVATETLREARAVRDGLAEKVRRAKAERRKQVKEAQRRREAAAAAEAAAEAAATQEAVLRARHEAEVRRAQEEAAGGRAGDADEARQEETLLEPSP